MRFYLNVQLKLIQLLLLDTAALLLQSKLGNWLYVPRSIVIVIIAIVYSLVLSLPSLSRFLFQF